MTETITYNDYECLQIWWRILTPQERAQKTILTPQDDETALGKIFSFAINL